MISTRRVDLAAVCATALWTVCGPAQTATSARQDGQTLPGDVRTFIERRERCDHFRGEDPTDDKRFEEISAALDRYCTGTDAELKKLKAAYKGDAAVQKALSAYEPDIE
ncbi:hypothetical protein [Bordetella genomosp. 13]|uniref:hypothetical protein n=1 Tax=Bordetella genomosp. 13 TaxID=463040 RepID=UPI0011A9EB73|nr:hypothetical protein [Bordetella genomosp. 13]